MLYGRAYTGTWHIAKPEPVKGWYMSACTLVWLHTVQPNPPEAHLCGDCTRTYLAAGR